jgi:hypothetical protein
MPNTYTPHYSLAKPSAGDVNWDDELNSNFDKIDNTLYTIQNNLNKNEEIMDWQPR